MKFVEAGKTANAMPGGKQVHVDGKGCFVQPTICDDVSHHDPLARDEICVRVLWVDTVGALWRNETVRFRARPVLASL